MQGGLQKRQKHRPKLMDRIGLWLSTGEEIDGLWVGTNDDQPEPIQQRLREALSLIKTHDRIRYERLTRDLKRVWALPLEYPTGCFDQRLDACKLNCRFVRAETTTLELLASLIVHEATHARLRGYGIGYEVQQRPRVEAICVRRQLAFSTKLANGQQAREWAEYALASHCTAEHLSDAARATQYDQQAIEELRHLGIPSWVIRTLLIVRPTVRAPIRLARWIIRVRKS